jgi:hypothetical protein
VGSPRISHTSCYDTYDVILCQNKALILNKKTSQNGGKQFSAVFKTEAKVGLPYAPPKTARLGGAAGGPGGLYFGSWQVEVEVRWWLRALRVGRGEKKKG